MIKNDLPIIIDKYFINIFDFILSITIILASFVFLGFENIYLLIAIFSFSILIVYLPKKLINNLMNEYRNLSIENSIYVQNLLNTVKGYDILLYNLRTHLFSKLVKDKTLKLNETEIRINKKIQFLMYFYTYIGAFFQLLIIFTSGILFILGQIDLGLVIVAGSISGNITVIVNNFSNYFVFVNSAKSVYDKILLEIGENNDERYIDISEIRKIELKDISFAYDEKKIFDKFSINLEKGKKYLIIGESGSGKSTLLDILMGNLKILSGSYIVDNKNFYNISFDSFYSKIGYINSENYIFDTNILDNISLYQDANIKKIDEIKDKLNISEIDNYKEISNSSLSTGQKQRINISREIYFDKDVIILDEATSNLDVENRKIVEDYLLNSDKIVIIVTHHYDIDFANKFDEVIRIGVNNG